jgi:signal transduction histidine kinase
LNIKNPQSFCSNQTISVILDVGFTSAVSNDLTNRFVHFKQWYSHYFGFLANKTFLKYTLLPTIPLSIIAILSLDPSIWMGSEIHHFYIELFGTILAGVLSFYYILHARKLSDRFSLFVGIGFLVSALIDLLHVAVSFSLIENVSFLKHFIPQTWFAGRIFLSSMLLIAISKYSILSPFEEIKGDDKELFNKEIGNDKVRSLIQQKGKEEKIQKNIIIYIIALGVFAGSIAIFSLFIIFPISVLDDYSLHRPYEIPPLILFSLTLFFFYKKHLYLKKDIIYKGILAYLIVDIFSQIIMSYSTTSFDTAHNIAHLLKDVGYFINIIALALSSVQHIVNLRESNELTKKQYEKIKESEKMKNDFINIAAHELRTPIQPILGLSKILSDRTGQIENYKEHIDIIFKNAKRLHKLADDILDASKIESHSLKINKEHFDLVEVVSTAIKDQVNQLGKDNENVVFSFNVNAGNLKEENRNTKDDSIMVKADKNRINQVLSNLLGNAIKFTQDGSISVMIKKNNKEIIVGVRDEGQGINREILPKLFDKFITDSTSGTGLGLYICKNIIEAHDGKIWAENNRTGKGATITFSLPLNMK